MPAHRPLAERFHEKVRFGRGCWLWTGATMWKGYGAIGYFGKVLRAHRVAWELCVGPIPRGRQVLHHCDNPACVRPNHLFLGTARDNSRDMSAKGRWRNQHAAGRTAT